MGFFVPARTVVPWKVAGRKPAPQLAGPLGANPRESGRATNVGRFSFSLPRPYETHAPMLGNPGSTKPVFCRKVAGPCTFDFAIMAGRNAMSSTHPARCGTRPLTYLPHSPCGFHGQGLAMTAPGELWKSSTLPPGSNFWPFRAIKAGL